QGRSCGHRHGDRRVVWHARAFRRRRAVTIAYPRDRRLTRGRPAPAERAVWEALGQHHTGVLVDPFGSRPSHRGCRQPFAPAGYVVTGAATVDPAAEASAARSRPGKRASRSSQRRLLMRCVPSERMTITPASRNTLKWCDTVALASGRPKLPQALSPSRASFW